MMNTLVNILLQNVASDLFGGYASWGLKVGVPLLITLILGEILPKNIGLQYNVSLSCYVAPWINIIQNLCSPLRKLIIAITTPISRIMFFYLRKADPISKEELRHTLETSEKQGVLNAEEAELVKGYLLLQEATVKEVMRQKSDVLFYNLKEPLTKLVFLMKEQECSRLPVCDGDLDKVLGIITTKDYFLIRNRIEKPKDLLPYLSKPYYVPESISARTLLRKFTEQNEKIALVVDEYGSIEGLIAEEDISELVVGEIVDLRDTVASFTRAGKNEIIAGGRFELSEFADIFDEELPNPNNLVTIGGWLMERLGDIPKTGDKYETEKYLFHVLRADPNRVRRVYIRKKEKTNY
jgi:CBS domain containing-hemolysin-like protein